jgi:hypothetical protein
MNRLTDFIRRIFLDEMAALDGDLGLVFPTAAELALGAN